jgi:8-oxo-dGTP pyrophosphatase MutT (NUDIX family)
MLLACRGGIYAVRRMAAKPNSRTASFFCDNVVVLSVESFRAALGDYQPRFLADVEGQTRAAVAAVLRPGEGGAEFLFIHRADDPRDPWSGHMAFPGGRVDPRDADPLATALRETSEEVGLDLASIAERIGRLSDVAAIGRGRPVNMVITPFVFAVESVPPLTPNHEVAAAVWVPASFLADHRNRETMDYQRAGLSLELPCYRYRDHLIWGLTLGMVDELLSLVVF